MAIAQKPRGRGRPPKVHPGFIETRDALIRAGVIALTEKGFPSTAVDEILNAVQVPKGSFYHYFESKEAFGAELIQSYSNYFVRRLDRFLLNAAERPLERLRSFTLHSRDNMARYQFKRGCLVGNLGQEMGALPESYRVRLIETLQDWQARTSKCLQEAQSEGSIAKFHDCDNLAEFFWVGWEGAVLRAKLERRGTPLTIFATGFFALVEK